MARDKPGKPVPELSGTLTGQYTTFIVLKFFTSTQPSLPGLPLYHWGLIMGRTWGKQLEKNMKNPWARTYTSFICA